MVERDAEEEKIKERKAKGARMAIGWQTAALALGMGLGTALTAMATGAEEGVEALSALGFFRQDVEAMQRTAQAFYGELGEVGGLENEGEGGRGRVDFFVLRESEVDALSPDLQEAVGGRRAVCIGQYRAGGVPHRALYSLDNPPVWLGSFRMEEGGRWAECKDGMPAPDPVAEKKEREGEEAAVPVRFHQWEPGPGSFLLWTFLHIAKDLPW